MAKKNYLKNLIANSKLASKVGLGMLLVAPLFMASSCEKPCDENDPKSDCYVQPPEPPVPPVEQHTTTYTFHLRELSVIEPTDTRVKQSADSLQVLKVVLEAIDSGWYALPRAKFTTVVQYLENKLAISPKVEATGTMTVFPGGIFPEDSLSLVEMGIEIKIREHKNSQKIIDNDPQEIRDSWKYSQRIRGR